MNLDPDLIRVDLLKVKRKLFLSFPPGSQEQKDFLVAGKLSELGYLSKLVPEDMAEMVLQEYNQVVKTEVINIVLVLASGALLSTSLFIFHQAYPKNVWLYLFSLPFWVALGDAIRHVGHLITQYRAIKPFKEEYKLLQQRIKKLTDDLKGMK